MNDIENYLDNRIKTAIEILELEIKTDQEKILEDNSTEEDTYWRKQRIKLCKQEKARLEKRI